MFLPPSQSRADRDLKQRPAPVPQPKVDPTTRRKFIACAVLMGIALVLVGNLIWKASAANHGQTGSLRVILQDAGHVIKRTTGPNINRY